MSRNKSKRKTTDELQKRMEDAAAALQQESDRACPLIAQEWVNDAIEELLYAEFTRNGVSTDEQNKLLKNIAAPLGSFAMRVAFCAAFGLIDQSIAKMLNDFRSIRNHCAHGLKVSLRDKDIEGEVQALREFVFSQAPDVILQATKLDEGLQALSDDEQRTAIRLIIAFQIVGESLHGERWVIIYSALYFVAYLHDMANQIQRQEPHRNTQLTSPPGAGLPTPPQP